MNKVGKSVCMNGVNYISIKACCEDLNIPYYTFLRFKKINSYDSDELALQSYIDSHKEIEYNGKKYKSLRACCMDLGIDSANISAFKARYSITSSQEAFDRYIEIFNTRVEYNGKVFLSKRECCEFFGLSYRDVNRIRARYKRKITFKDALDKLLIYNEPLKLDHSSAPKPYEYKGVVYTSKTYCCLSLGLNYTTVSSYASRHGLSFEDALDRCITGDTYSVKYRGRIYLSKQDLCNKFGIKRVNVSELSRGHNICYFDALDCAILRKSFHLPMFETFMKESIFNCRCKICGKEFLFTRDLAFKHIEECYVKD